MVALRGGERGRAQRLITGHTAERGREREREMFSSFSFLPQAFRRFIGVRIREEAEIIEGEVA